LKTLSKTKSINKRNKILKNATTDQLLCLVEICLNIVKSRFKLTTRQKKRLLPYADYIRRLSRIRSENTAKRLIQKGSGLGPLFAALLTPIIIEITKNLSKNTNVSE
jgi:hypothetical protein